MSEGDYRVYFGLKRDPFSKDIAARDLQPLPQTLGVKQRLDYALPLGGVMVVTGEVGSGKSSALRYAASQLHPSDVKVAHVVANTGSVTELYRLISWGLDLDPVSSSSSKLLREIKGAAIDLAKSKRQKVVVMIDEASLMRTAVFSELHTLISFEQDSKPYITLVLCGQASLIDKLQYRSSAPLASRVMAKSHLTTLPRGQLDDYLLHHLTICGVKKPLFDPAAVNAIFQGSSGMLRKINDLARGGLLACASEGKDHVTAEHIRRSASELM